MRKVRVSYRLLRAVDKAVYNVTHMTVPYETYKMSRYYSVPGTTDRTVYVALPRPGYTFDFVDISPTVPNRLSGMSFNICSHTSGLPSDDTRKAKGTFIKPGKFVKWLTGIEDDKTVSQVTAKLVQDLTSSYVSTDKIEITKEVSSVYTMRHILKGTIGGSCMRDKSSEYFEIYERANCEIAYLKDSDGYLLARALIWHGLTVSRDQSKITMMDRVYYSNDNQVATFQKLAKEKGWYSKVEQNSHCENFYNPDGAVEHLGLSIPVDVDGLDAVPYYDTLWAWDESKGLMHTGHLCVDDSFRGLDGASEEGLIGAERLRCTHCEDGIHESDVCYSPMYSEPLCEHCYDELPYCRYCEEEHVESEDEFCCSYCEEMYNRPLCMYCEDDQAREGDDFCSDLCESSFNDDQEEDDDNQTEDEEATEPSEAVSRDQEVEPQDQEDMGSLNSRDFSSLENRVLAYNRDRVQVAPDSSEDAQEDETQEEYVRRTRTLAEYLAFETQVLTALTETNNPTESQ